MTRKEFEALPPDISAHVILMQYLSELDIEALRESLYDALMESTPKEELARTYSAFLSDDLDPAWDKLDQYLED